MPTMLRRFAIPFVIFAALIAVEPLLHSHPLQQSAIPGTCAVCATCVGRIPPAIPAIGAPSVVVYTLTTLVATVAIALVVLTLPSRAPPLA